MAYARGLAQAVPKVVTICTSRARPVRNLKLFARAGSLATALRRDIQRRVAIQAVMSPELAACQLSY